MKDLEPTKGLEYFISSQHWLDAMTPPLEKHLARLARTAKQLLEDRDGITASASSVDQRPSKTNRHWKRWLATGAAVIILIAAALAARALTTGTKPEVVPVSTVAHRPPASEPAKPDHDPTFVEWLHASFARADVDRSTKLSPEELRAFYRAADWKASPDFLTAWSRELDTNGDLALSEQEMMEMGNSFLQAMDINGDGKVTMAEVLQFLSRQGDNTPHEKSTSSRFKSLDANHDGFLTPQEVELALATIGLGNL
jgi:Ca2+-binding EF-hand superfamily protein